jgi:hypothetical protein
VFAIEDERHAEPIRPLTTFEAAMEELGRYARTPWDEPPNGAPCGGWVDCWRWYEVVEYDISVTPWIQLRRTPRVLHVSA